MLTQQEEIELSDIMASQYDEDMIFDYQEVKNCEASILDMIESKDLVSLNKYLMEMVR